MMKITIQTNGENVFTIPVDRNAPGYDAPICCFSKQYDNEITVIFEDEQPPVFIELCFGKERIPLYMDNCDSGYGKWIYKTGGHFAEYINIIGFACFSLNVVTYDNCKYLNYSANCVVTESNEELIARCNNSMTTKGCDKVDPLVFPGWIGDRIGVTNQVNNNMSVIECLNRTAEFFEGHENIFRNDNVGTIADMPDPSGENKPCYMVITGKGENASQPGFFCQYSNNPQPSWIPVNFNVPTTKIPENYFISAFIATMFIKASELNKEIKQLRVSELLLPSGNRGMCQNHSGNALTKYEWCIIKSYKRNWEKLFERIKRIYNSYMTFMPSLGFSLSGVPCNVGRFCTNDHYGECFNVICDWFANQNRPAGIPKSFRPFRNQEDIYDLYMLHNIHSELQKMGFKELPQQRKAVFNSAGYNDYFLFTIDGAEPADNMRADVCYKPRFVPESYDNFMSAGATWGEADIYITLSSQFGMSNIILNVKCCKKDELMHRGTDYYCCNKFNYEENIGCIDKCILQLLTDHITGESVLCCNYGAAQLLGENSSKFVNVIECGEDMGLSQIRQCINMAMINLYNIGLTRQNMPRESAEFMNVPVCDNYLMDDYDIGGEF